MITIELNEKLAALAGGIDRVEVDATTVHEAVIALAKIYRPIGGKLLNCEGEMRTVVRVEVNGNALPPYEAAATPLHDGDMVRLSFP